MHNYRRIKLGIVGGGQLGRMLIQAALNYDITTIVIDPDEDAPCRDIAHRFITGDIKDYDTIYNFGRQADIITIEIEHVNADALLQLEREGKKIYPQPGALKIIQDKGLQKVFYRENEIPTAPFQLVEQPDDLYLYQDMKPFYMKMRKSGYDGRGVRLIESESDFDNAFQAPAVIEKAVDVRAEISIIVARNVRGEICTYPPVGMQFHPEANLVEYLYAPVELPSAVLKRAEDIAVKVARALQITGLLAVEMFIDHNNNVMVNEVAPRVHNSGHHTIEANVTSQFDQHLRAILDFPLGNTELRTPAIMVNLLGEPGYRGEARYTGLDEVLRIPGVYVHLYGKKETWPFRKMGHVTIIDRDLDAAREKARLVKDALKVIA